LPTTGNERKVSEIAIPKITRRCSLLLVLGWLECKLILLKPIFLQISKGHPELTEIRTFPDRFNGTWCLGYHDGEKAHFPAHTVQLDQPPKDDVTMNPNSTLSATARWEHRPKDPNSGWLSFGKKEKIIHIGFPFQDMWCWTGQNSKGKWGLFPADFMEGLNESLDIGRRGSENKAPAITFSEPFGRPPGSRSGSLSASVTSPQSAGTGQSGWNTLKGKASMKGFGLHRKSTSASHNSQSSNGSSNGRRPSADVIPE
jgi:hypothetical protein